MKNIEEKELEDFLFASSHIKKEFGRHYLGSDKLPPYSPVDMTFSASTGSNVRCYALEIKSTPKSTYLSQGFLLKVSKYIRIMRFAAYSGHSPFIMYICDGRYYVYDLSRIKLTLDNLRNINLKVKEYDDNSQSTYTACISLRPENAIFVKNC